MTCRIAYICGKQGLPIIPMLSGIGGSENLMIFASPAALSELNDKLHNVRPIVSPESLRAALEIFSPDVILVMTYLSKLDHSLSALSKYGMVNIHPSLLPKYRGGSPVFYAIKNGEETVGVTYHFITEAFDQGEIIEQFAVKVLPSDCASSVWMKIVKKIMISMPGVIESRSAWRSMAIKQSESQATSVGFPAEDEKSLSCHKTSAENLSVIRACGRTAGARLSLGDHVFFVTEAAVSSPDMDGDDGPEMWVVQDNVLFIKAADGWLKICDASLHGRRILSWGFLMEGTNDDA